MLLPASLAGLTALVVTLPTLLVRQHVRALLYFGAEGTRTKPPEELSASERLRVLVTGATIPRPLNTRTPTDLGFAFQTTLIDTDDDHRLEVWTVPGGPQQVVLFHGYTAQKDQVIEALPWFAARGFTVHLVDFRASGGSTGNRTTLGAEEALDVVAAVRWAREQREGSLAVYGFSMGGAAILGALGRHGLHVEAAIVDGVYDRLSNTLAHRFHTMGLPASPGREMLLAWGSIELRRNAWRVAPVEDAAAAPHPVLVLVGTADPRVHTAEAEAITAALPNGRLRLMEQGGHAPGFETAPNDWSDAASSFLVECGFTVQAPPHPSSATS